MIYLYQFCNCVKGMIKSLYPAVIVIALVTTAVPGAAAFAQSSQDLNEWDIATISGTISSRDEFNNRITVRWFDDSLFSEQEREVPITVNDDTRIYQGSDEIGISDLMPGEAVTVRYRTDKNGTPVAVTITQNQ